MKPDPLGGQRVLFLACALALVSLATAGCASTPPKATDAPSTSAPSVTTVVSPTAEPACTVHPLPTAATTYVPFLQGNIDVAAKRLLHALQDPDADHAATTPLPAGAERPQSRQWALQNASLVYQQAQLADDAVDAHYWPHDSWSYTAPRSFPSADDATSNATIVRILANTTGIPASRLHSQGVPEPMESETEFHVRQAFGDLAGFQFANWKVGHPHGRNMTRLEITDAFLMDDTGLLSQARLSAAAHQDAACLMQQWGHPNAFALLQDGVEQTVVVNGTLVEEFGFTLPASHGKPGCWSMHVMALLVDAHTGQLRDVLKAPVLDACLKTTDAA